MRPPSRPPGRTLRAAALALVLGFAALILRFRHPVFGFTTLIQFDRATAAHAIGAFRRQPVYIYPGAAGYDGQAYAALAHHPLLCAAELAPAMDDLAYRGRRILVPALAWILALGRERWILPVYTSINILVWFGCALLLWRALPVRDWRGWLAWAGFLLSAGALASVRLALTDLPAALLILAALHAAERARRPLPSAVLLGAAALSRETSVLALPGVLRRPFASRSNLPGAVCAGLPLALWLVYIRVRLGSSGFSGGGNFSLPAAGLAGKARECLHALAHSQERLGAWAMTLCTVGLAVQATYLLLHPRPGSPWWRAAIPYVGLMLVTGGPVWEGYPGAIARVLLPLSLVFAVQTARERAPIGWILGGNLTVLAGLITLTTLPPYEGELGAGRAGATPYVVQTGAGWYGVEHGLDRRWSWSAGRATLVIETWEPRRLRARLSLALRSLSERTVTVESAGGALLWRGSVGPRWNSLSIPLAPDTVSGAATVVLKSDSPPMRESQDPTSRALCFAVQRVRLEP